MADVVLSVVAGVARTWRQEAEERRRISKTDPIADTLEYCAGEISARLKSIEETEQFLTVAEFANRESVTDQTVRNWIRAGRIAATETPKGYKIDAAQIAPLRKSA
jgi:excisionase family DNA binding protein